MMTAETVTTWDSATTTVASIWLKQAQWKGQDVWVQSEQDCGKHRLEEMHHLGEDGKHYCPTGFVWCPECGGTAHVADYDGCQRWGE